MAGEGLVRIFDGQWRPTDDVIEALDLLDWDTLELVAAARDCPGETDIAT